MLSHGGGGGGGGGGGVLSKICKKCLMMSGTKICRFSSGRKFDSVSKERQHQVHIRSFNVRDQHHIGY